MNTPKQVAVNVGTHDLTDLFRGMIFSNLFDSKAKTYYSGGTTGTLHSAFDLFSFLKKNGYREVYNHIPLGKVDDCGEAWDGTPVSDSRGMFNHDTQTLCEYSIGDSSFQIFFLGFDRTGIISLTKEIKKHLIKVPPAGRVRMIVRSPTGYEIRNVGKISFPFVETNYPSGIIEGYNFIKEQLSSKTPSGRFVLLRGDPGTGKSFFIKGLITDNPGLFVYVPSTLIGSISGPEFVSAVLGEKSPDHPIVLIVEDADASLLTRSTDNLSKISDILNLTDGILGDMADIRVIATTNAKSVDVDRAILRPGRLCRELTFDKLSREQVVKLYLQLTGEELAGIKEEMTLAEVYVKAKDAGWKLPESGNKNKDYGQYL